jgi:hypothetical protein
LCATLINIPARAAMGISAAQGPKKININKSVIA